MPPKKRRQQTFNLTHWCTDAKLTTKARKALADNGLQDEDTLLMLGPQDIPALQLPLAQQIRLRRALMDLGSTQFEAGYAPGSDEQSPQQVFSPTAAGSPKAPPERLPSPSPERTSSQKNPIPEPLLTAGRTLDELMGALDTKLGAEHKPDTMGDLGYDPRIHLTLKASARKAVKIFQFLPDKVKDRIQRSRRDRFVISQNTEGGFAFEARDPDTFAISPSEWNAANIRILGHLLGTGDLPRDQTEFYLAYTAQINDMAEVYEWPSILTFDARYRELQAEHGFKWGDLRMAAHSTVLLPKRQITQISNRPRNGLTHAHQPKTEDCKKWLASGCRFCPFGSQCRYLHRTPDSSSGLGQAGVIPPTKNFATSQATVAL